MKGLRIPIQASAGRLETVRGEDQLRKVIVLNLSDCESSNPFQDIGIGSAMVFDVDDPTTRARISRNIATLFKRLEREGRARLSQGYPIFTADQVSQELHCEVRYVNLETTREEEISILYATALSGVAQVEV